jgi:WD40 repeat protein
MMQQWLGLFVKVTKPVLTTLVYTGINTWLEAFQEEIKERQKQQAKRVLDSLSVEEIANKQRVAVVKTRKTLAIPEIKKHPDLWPLRLSPQQLLKNSSGPYSNPLRIFLAPPKKKSPEFSHLDLETTDIEQRISQALREFLNKNYSLQAPSKATEFLSGSWNNSNFHGEASIKAVFEVLQSLPTIILHTEIEGSHIAFYLAYWSKLSRKYSYEKIFNFNYKTFLEESLKARVLNWKAVRHQLLTLGKSTEDIQRLGGNCELNLAMVEEVETLQAAGINTEELNFTYQFDRQDFDSLCQFLSICHCLVAGWVADIHYLVNDDLPPHLSLWLPLLGEAISDSQAQQAIFRATVSLYQDLLTVLGNKSSQEIPELALKLAESLMHLPDSSLAIAQVKYSFDCWRQQHQFSVSETSEALESIYSSLKQRDWQYLAKLQRCLSTFREEEQITPIREIVNALSQKSAMFNSRASEERTSFQLHHKVTIVAEKVFSLTTHTNGNQLISQQQNNILKLWRFDANNGHLSPSHELAGHLGKILAVAHCSEGQLLASSDNTDQRSYIRIWDLPTGKLMKTLFGHKQPIHALAINSDRSFLASGSHKIKLWDLKTGESWLTLFGHKKKVSCLAISNDGQTLISGSQDKTIRIWDLKTGDLCKTLQGHQCSVNTVVLSADGQTLVSGSEDKTIKIWNVKTGKLLHTLTGHSGGVQVLTLSEYHQQLVSGCKGGTINLWEIETGELGEICGAVRLQTLMGHQREVRALAFSYDGQVLASSCQDGMLQLWKSSL